MPSAWYVALAMWRVAGVVCSALLLGACQADSEFRCQRDNQCVSGGQPGLCQDSGYCSFPDSTCPTGQRYGSGAAQGLAGECVEPTDAANTAGGGAASGTAGTSASMDGSGGEGGPVDPTEPPEVTTGVTAGGTGGESVGGDSLGDASDGGESSTAGVKPICPTFFDDFDDPDPWWVQAVGSAVIANGSLRFSANSENEEGSIISADVDFQDAAATIRVISPPVSPMFFGIELVPSNSAARVGIVIRTYNGPRTVQPIINGVQTGPPDNAADSEIWLRLRHVGSKTLLEHGGDGVGFSPLDTIDGDFALAAVRMFTDQQLFGVTPQVIEVDSFEFCASSG